MPDKITYTPLEEAALNAQQFSINLVFAAAIAEVLRRNKEVEAFAASEQGSYSSRESVRQAREEVEKVFQHIALSGPRLGYGVLQA